MGFLEIVMIAIGLSMDCFAVSIAYSVSNKEIRFNQALVFAFFFGLFQGGMPLLGWISASYFKNYIIAFDHWIAFGLLGIIGLKMIIESFSKSEAKEMNLSLWLIFSLSLATSIDALIVGVSMAFLKINMLYAALIIAGITLFISMIGFRLGKFFGFSFGKKAEFAGGLILIFIGTKILIEHLSN